MELERHLAMKMPFDITLEKNRKHSTLKIAGNQIYFQCVVNSAYSTRNRRQLLMTIYQAVLPHLEFVARSSIHHSHHPFPEVYNSDEFAVLSTKQGIHVTNDRSRLGYFIRGIRTKIGMTQVQFADDLSITPSYLSKIEKGHRTPSPKMLLKIYKMKNAPGNLYP